MARSSPTSTWGPTVLPLTADDITIAFLPSAHIAQRVVVEILPILSGTAVSFAESLLKLQHEIKAVRPTFFLAPPRVWERVYTSIRTEILKKPAIAQKAFFAALGAGARRRQIQADAARRCRFASASRCKLAHRVIFSKIRDRFGGRLRDRGLRRRSSGRGSRGILRSDRHAADRRLRADRRRRRGV